MPRPTYTFDTDGHTVVAGDSAKKKEYFWGQSRGDRIITSALLSSMIFAYIVAMTAFTEDWQKLIFLLPAMLSGVIFPLHIVSSVFPNWINNELPPFSWQEMS